MGKDTISLGLKNTLQTLKTNSSLIWYFSDCNYDQNIYHLWSYNIYVSTTYHMSVYNITY